MSCPLGRQVVEGMPSVVDDRHRQGRAFEQAGGANGDASRAAIATVASGAADTTLGARGARTRSVPSEAWLAFNSTEPPEPPPPGRAAIAQRHSEARYKPQWLVTARATA